MARPTLITGDLWDDDLANASIRPFVSEDDVPGAMLPIKDDELDDDPDMIKARFYGFYDRVQVSVLSGLLVQWSAYEVMLPDGSVVSRSAGQTAVTDNASRFIIINSVGDIAVVTAMPNVRVAVAYVVASGGSITEFRDLRYQRLEQVTVGNLPAAVVPWQVGDIKESARSSPESGWLPCDGRLIESAAYPVFAAAVGTAYNTGGEPTGFIRIPDRRRRVAAGAGNGYSIGQYVGAETRTLAVSNIPSHTHGVSQSPHTHGTTANPHNHAATQQVHKHDYTDPWHRHVITYHERRVALDPGGPRVMGVPLDGGDSVHFTQSQPTSISIADSLVPFTNIANTANVNVQPNTAPVTINPTGSGAAFSIVQPTVVTNFFIKVE